MCTSPLKAVRTADGRISFSKKDFRKDLEVLDLPCSKCIECRFSKGREKSLRCFHEAQFHDASMFLTLTYDDEHLRSPRLVYPDFQKFMKRLRRRSKKKVTFMVTGEYGELNKRPHWHAIIFGYEFPNKKVCGSNSRGEDYFDSPVLDDMWPFGRSNFGAVTPDSASYVGRYSLKKLVHGKDSDHDFHPLHRTSGVNALGKRWIEKFWHQTFVRLGFCYLPNGCKTKIPRYYSDWCKVHQPAAFEHYVTHHLPHLQRVAADSDAFELEVFKKNMESFEIGVTKSRLTQKQVRSQINQIRRKRLEREFKL